MSEPEAQAERLEQAIFEGRKIEAIKLYREQTGVGLKESKDAVEELERKLRQSDGDRFTGKRKSGCLSLVVGIAAVVGFFVVHS